MLERDNNYYIPDPDFRKIDMLEEAEFSNLNKKTVGISFELERLANFPFFISGNQNYFFLNNFR